MIYVTQLTILLNLPFTVTLRTSFFFYRIEVALEAMRITVVKSLLIGGFFIDFMAGAATMLRIHQIDALGIQQRDMGAVGISRERSRITRSVSPLCDANACFVLGNCMALSAGTGTFLAV